MAPGFGRGATQLMLGAVPGPTAGVRAVALLAPLTGPNAERGQALVNAAKLALDAPGSPRLDVRDTGGTAQGAAEAARAAIAAGDGIIIGPLTGTETGGVASVARAAGIPVIAFTNDASQAQPGVWPLGITAAQQIRRLVGAVEGQGKTRFAAVLPQNDFGRALASALRQATSSTGAPAPDIRTYPAGGSMDAAVREVAGVSSRLGPLMSEMRAARPQAEGGGQDAAASAPRQDIPPPPFDALLVAESSGRLATLTALLQGSEVAAPNVRLLGPVLWTSPEARGSASLTGAWYAGPDPTASSGFEQQYTAKYGSVAPGISDFAFDAASVARVLASEGSYAVGPLCRPDGYAGVDGVFALQPDGTVRRGLALFEIQRGAPQMIEPAPATIGAPGI